MKLFATRVINIYTKLMSLLSLFVLSTHWKPFNFNKNATVKYASVNVPDAGRRKNWVNRNCSMIGNEFMSGRGFVWNKAIVPGVCSIFMEIIMARRCSSESAVHRNSMKIRLSRAGRHDTTKLIDAIDALWCGILTLFAPDVFPLFVPLQSRPFFSPSPAVRRGRLLNRKKEVVYKWQTNYTRFQLGEGGGPGSVLCSNRPVFWVFIYTDFEHDINIPLRPLLRTYF